MAMRIIPESVRRMQASKSMRLQHELWHYVRAVWSNPDFGEDGRSLLRTLKWDLPGDRSPRSADGHLLLDNFSGEDFLFMHRDMIAMTDHHLHLAGEPPISRWSTIPLPGDSDFPVPPAWDYADPNDSPQSNAATTRFLRFIKSDQYFETTMSLQEKFLTSPTTLRALSLGAIGNLAEMTIHNAMHMRWSSEPVGYRPGVNLADPAGGDPRFDALDYDYLGDTYSSHVNPHFWYLHGWIDDLIERWAAANQVPNITWTGTWTGGPDLVPALTSAVPSLTVERDEAEFTLESNLVRDTVEKLMSLSAKLPVPPTLLEITKRQTLVPE